MKKDYQATIDSAAMPVPGEVWVVMGELAGELREGLLAMAVGAGLQVMHAVLDEQVRTLCGPKGRHDRERTANRHGTEDGSVVLGGRKVPVRHPRVRRGAGSGEVSLPAYALFSC